MRAFGRKFAAATERPQVRKWLKRALIAVLVYMLYPITVTLALSTGLVEKMLASEDLRVEISAPSWSLLPGDIHMGGVKIFMNGDTQFILVAENITAQIRILPLFRRRFEVASLSAKNVKYQMRVQLEGAEAQSARALAFPPLEGLPGVQTKSEEVGAQTEERSPNWTVRLDGIDVSVRELWFMEYRYLGDGRLQGGFERGPDRMRVDTSVQDLGPGQLRFGAEQIISKNFQGQVEAEIPELDPSEHADTSFFEFVIAKIRLRADLETLAHVAAYIPGNVKVTGGAGPLDVKIWMDRGKLARETAISFVTEDVGLRGDGFGVKTDWTLAIDMGDTEAKRAAEEKSKSPKTDAKKDEVAKPDAGPRPHLKSTSRITYVSLATEGKNAFTIQIQGHEETAALNSSKIGSDTEVESARIHLPKIVTEDLDDLDTLTSKSDSIRSQGGRAEASLTLEMDEKHRLNGPFKADFDGVTLAFDQLRVATNGHTRFFVTLDPKRDQAAISDLSFALRDARFQVGDESVDGWWINLKSERFSFAGLPADTVRGDLAIVARDAEPVIQALAEDGKVPGIVADIISLRNLKVLAKVRKRQETIDVLVDTMESDIIDFSGRILQGPKQSRIALLIGGKTVSLGIDKHGEHTGFEAFAGTDWLNERLSHFPKPVEFVKGDKP